MLGDSVGNRVLIRTVITFFQWFGPLCAGYTAYRAVHLWPRWPINDAWSTYCAVEAAWYVFMVWYVRHLQGKAKHPPMRSREERNALFHKVRTEIHDPESFVRGWFRGWHMEEIGRDEVRTFLGWAFWDGEAKEEDRAEVDEYVNKMEEMLGKPFQQKRGKARSLRLTVDPIEIEARSLFWYGIIMAVDMLTFVKLRRNGFQYHRTSITSLAIFPPRPLAIAATDVSVSRRLSYWLRPHTSKTRLPILYIHGIGIGLISQLEFLHELDQALNCDRSDDDLVGIIALEVLQVSSRLTHAILARNEFRAELRSILDYYGWNRLILACHSYGSILSSHILSDQHLTSRISATLMVDPVTILLHMPDVAYNFTVRPPKKANEWLLWYFASKDPGVAHTLGRHLFWSETVLWRDEIMQLTTEQNMRFTISLASDDLIVDTAAVGAYVMHGIKPDPVVVESHKGRETKDLVTLSKDDGWKSQKWSGSEPLNVVWWQGYDHAQCYDGRADRAKLVDILVDYSKGT